MVALVDLAAKLDKGGEPYASWKKVAWRFGRVFISAFVVTLAAALAEFDGSKLVAEGMQNGFWAFLTALWGVVFYPAVLSAIVAAISALGKAVREYFGDAEYKSKVHKLPV